MSLTRCQRGHLIERSAERNCRTSRAGFARYRIGMGDCRNHRFARIGSKFRVANALRHIEHGHT